MGLVHLLMDPIDAYRMVPLDVAQRGSFASGHYAGTSMVVLKQVDRGSSVQNGFPKIQGWKGSVPDAACAGTELNLGRT